MKWTNAVMAVTFVFAAASVWACGDDNNTGLSSGTAPVANPCGEDDPTTELDESECRELANADSGRQAVTTRGCTQCHGEDMAGKDTPLTGKPSYERTLQGDEVKLYPPNLTFDATALGYLKNGKPAWTDEKLAEAIRTGIDEDAQQLCPQMQHFSKMSDFEVYSIVLYLRSLPPVPKAVPRSICPPTKIAGQ